MSDSVIITLIICITLVGLAWIGSNKQVGDLKGTISRYTE